MSKDLHFPYPHLLVRKQIAYNSICEVWLPLNRRTIKILHVPMDATPVKCTCGF